jgi:hypothetical protein
VRILYFVSVVMLLGLGLTASALAEEATGPPPLRIVASTGFDFSTGDFGSTTESDIWYVPFGLKLEREPFIVKLTVPYLLVDGDVAIVGDQPEPISGLAGARDGVGDIVLATSYVYYPGPSVSFLPRLELTGKIKFGTADEDEGLGTGENDYTLQLDFSKSFGMLTPFAGVGYKVIGDSSDVDFLAGGHHNQAPASRTNHDLLNDKWFAYAGFTAKLHDRFNLGLAYDWNQSSVPGNGGFHELTPFATVKFGRRFAIDPYMLVGISKFAADWGIGMQLRFIYDL